MKPETVAQAPRIFCITATGADVAAVLRRGPSRWFHLGRWNTDDGTYTPGAWLRGRIYPQRCDLSPDGALFSYMALHASDWSVGDTYIAISKLPWLTALAAWPTPGTYSSGAHFVIERSAFHLGAPHVGHVEPLRKRYGLQCTQPASFAVERRRGWTETADTPPRPDGDTWDERRGVLIQMEKPNPALADCQLRVRGTDAAFRTGSDREDIEYELEIDGQTRTMPEAQWAEWDRRGRLLLATRDGHLQIVDLNGAHTIVADVDLSDRTPRPEPPPLHATAW